MSDDKATLLADRYYKAQEKRLSVLDEKRPEPEIGFFKSESREPKPPDDLFESTALAEGLDADEIERLIFALDGNVKEIAKYLNVRSARVRAFIQAKPQLKRAIGEVYENAVDEAVGVLFEGLRSDSFQNRFYAAKEWLKSDGGRKRGFGRDPGLAATIEVKQGAAGGGSTIVLKWIEPDGIEPPKIIDGEIK